jgi:hypothetical protein
MSPWTRFCDLPFRMLLPFVPQSLSVLAFTTVSQVNQSCFSLRDNKDVIIVCVDFGSPGRSANGKLDGMF